MTRRTAAAASSAALVALATVCACTGTATSPGDKATTTSPTATATSDEPIELAQVPEGTALEPGEYSMRILHGDGPTRAVVDVPAGYVSVFDGEVIGSDGNGDMAFWGNVSQVDTDPCLGGKHVSAGASVRDLAALLVAQRHMTASQPAPVTIGGYRGRYLELTAPADLDRCRHGSVTIYAAGGDWLADDAPSGTVNVWILNVDGERVVGGTRILPGADAASRSELMGMVNSAEFITAD
jgi:hypothetical protein